MSVMKPIILIVDDEYETIQVIEAALSDEYRIITADNGKTALEKISSLNAFLERIISTIARINR